MKDKFNKYCANVLVDMGQVVGIPNKLHKGQDEILISIPRGKGEHIYAVPLNPFDDLNQRIPIFDHLYRQLREHDARDLFWKIYKHGIDIATKDYIISTMPESDL